MRRELGAIFLPVVLASAGCASLAAPTGADARAHVEQVRWDEWAEATGGPFEGRYVAFFRPDYNPAGFSIYESGPGGEKEHHFVNEDQLVKAWNEVAPFARWTGKFRAADGSVSDVRPVRQ